MALTEQDLSQSLVHAEHQQQPIGGQAALPQTTSLEKVPEEEQELPPHSMDFALPRSPHSALRRSTSTKSTSRLANRGSSFNAISHNSKLHSSHWARRSTQAGGLVSGQVMARHGSMIMRPLGRQSSMGQGKRLSARALLGAFGPMGLSAVLFDLQGKIDADQLQVAQVHDLLFIATALCLGGQRHVDMIYACM